VVGIIAAAVGPSGMAMGSGLGFAVPIGGFRVFSKGLQGV
jgi:hypothetical protein